MLLAFHSDSHAVDLDPKHRFPMDKYALTRQQLHADATLQGKIDFREAPLASSEELAYAHEPAYVRRFMEGALDAKEMRSIGFPWSMGLVARARGSAGGTLAATRAVLEWQLPLACNIAGGTHHAFPDRGEGFCVFNDIAVAAGAAMREYGLQRVLVIDCDVHQGNGTAAICAGDERVTTFDMHGDKNYPWKTRMQNTYDIALPDATSDAEYLSLLGDWLPRLIERHEPELVFYQAGVDALKEDSFGRLAMTREGLQTRNQLVFSKCLQEGVPLVIVMGGGYSRPVEATVNAHADVYRQAALMMCSSSA
ncbi:hypothetical protein WJX72_012375 [[Myrmecia] bisecta]|uniref:Histone deacetylase domain-containing protein n=1 Tax=[Myrmecia] bisecta TaxID=41462 RepID=A0AAW1RAC6_9CHLO